MRILEVVLAWSVVSVVVGSMVGRFLRHGGAG